MQTRLCISSINNVVLRGLGQTIISRLVCEVLKYHNFILRPANLTLDAQNSGRPFTPTKRKVSYKISKKHVSYAMHLTKMPRYFYRFKMRNMVFYNVRTNYSHNAQLAIIYNYNLGFVLFVCLFCI